MRNDRKVVIGVGGTIGSGKTTVTMIFKELGAHCISADEVGWDVLSEIKEQLRQKFGNGIISGNTIDKGKLRNIVFWDCENLDYLNSLSHPLLIKKIKNKLVHIDSEMVVIDAALLFDWQEIYELVDYPILVVADEGLKQMRAENKGIDKELFKMILACQKNEVEMSRQAKFIIKNNGTVSGLKKQCLKIYKEIQDDCRVQ